MLDTALSVIDLVQKELLLLASICFLIGSTDDFVFDLLWLGHKIRRRLFVYSRHDRASLETLDRIATPDRPLAVFVPAWREAAVIGPMLSRCRDRWQGHNFRLYLGCYPNDCDTITAAAVHAQGWTDVRIVLCDNNGPTTKADCLNQLWAALCRDEIDEQMTFKAVVLHDAEDIVHPGSLSLFDHLIDRASLIQLPVIPRRAITSTWIAGHYGDEFAEMHGKQMVLREALGVSIPSAGVGCAFARDALQRLAIRSSGKPFDASSMTEDYELGLNMTGDGNRGIFARLKDQHGQLVATQEFFPENLEDAIRQKSRWMAGIALSGWDRLGWEKGWLENWMRLRDRKASLAATVLALGYLAVILTGLLMAAQIAGIYSIQPLSGFLTALLFANLGFLAWRLLFKAYFVFRLYGLREALLSIPRTVVANLINIMAAWRALGKYTRQLSGGQIEWDKTTHFLPDVDAVQELRRLNLNGKRG